VRKSKRGWEFEHKERVFGGERKRKSRLKSDAPKERKKITEEKTDERGCMELKWDDILKRNVIGTSGRTELCGGVTE